MMGFFIKLDQYENLSICTRSMIVCHDGRCGDPLHSWVLGHKEDGYSKGIVLMEEL